MLPKDLTHTDVVLYAWAAVFILCFVVAWPLVLLFAIIPAWHKRRVRKRTERAAIAQAERRLAYFTKSRA